MARLLLFAFFLLLLSPAAAAAPWFGALGRWRAAVSLSHSLLLRVGNARSARGDSGGAARARAWAQNLELRAGASRGSAGGLWPMLWDYLRHYAWRGGGGLGSAEAAAEIYRAAGQLASSLQQFGQLKSDAARAHWLATNYSNMSSAARKIFKRLSQSFWRPGALREMVMMLQKEVVDGDLVKDCLLVGAQDLEGLVAVARDLFFSSNTDSFAGHDYDL